MGSPQFPKVRTGGDASRTQDNIAGQLSPVARAVASSPMLDGTLPTWQRLSLTPDFVNNTTANVAAVAWHKDSLGYVHLQGNADTAAGQAAGFVFVTLPAGARPRNNQYLPVAGNGTVIWVIIRPTGTIELGSAVGAGSGLALSGSFLADG
jgi:hypothetical protein